MIRYWHGTVVCLSVCLWRCAHWLNDTSYSKCLNEWIGSAPFWKRSYNFQPPALTNVVLTLKLLLNHRPWCLLANKTAELSQRRQRDAPNIWVPLKFLRVLPTHRATFPEICKGLLFRSTLRMCVQNLKFVALPVPEIIGGTRKIWAVPGYAHTPFSSKFLIGFCSHGPSEYTCQIWRS